MYRLRFYCLIACSVGIPTANPAIAQTQLPPLVVEGSKSKPKKSPPTKSAPAITPVASPTPPPSQQTLGRHDGLVAERTTAGTKTDTPLIEIPQSISVVTRQQMDERNVQSLNEVLRYTAGVQAGDTSDLTTETFAIRGYNAPFLSVYRDGLREMFRGFDSVTEAYGLQRVEILKGPASVLYGQGIPGASST
jgi:outer membrane receptor protein involved in Fe transport